MTQLAAACPLFLKHLSLEQGFIGDVLNWMQAKPKPSYELIKKHVMRL